MQVSVETTGKLERRMTVRVPAERIESEIDNRLRSLGKRARVKGFRPGKVPFGVLKQQYGSQVRDEVLGELLRVSFSEAVQREKLNPAGGPKIDPVSMEPGKGLEYTATFEVYPEITLKDVTALEIERPVADVTEADVDRMIENLRRQRGTWHTVERAAREGDRVTIDFEGDVAGKPFPGNRGERVPVLIGANRMVEGFERKLEGAKAGATLEFTLRFPKDYPTAELADKDVHFSVTVHEVAELILPPVDEEFCRSFGITEGGVERLRQEVAENMRSELEETIRRRMKDQVLEALLGANDVDIPRALVDEEIERLKRDALSRMGLLNTGRQPPELPRELFEPQARRRVALGLLLGEVIRSEKITLDQARVHARLQELVAGAGEPDKVMRAYRSNPMLMRQIETVVLEDQAVEKLIERARIKERKTTFAELMKFGETSGE